MRGDADRWDARYEAAPPARPEAPEGLGSVSVAVPSSGRALDVACGLGGQVVWAARRGLDVVGLDVSPVAVEATRQLARAHGVARRVDVRVHDLDAGLPAGLGRFDLVICQRFRAPGIVPSLVAALADGGLAVLSVLSVVGAAAPGPHHAPPGELAALVRATGVDVLLGTEGDGRAVVVARASGRHRPG